jgi:hypothetical protein
MQKEMAMATQPFGGRDELVSAATAGGALTGAKSSTRLAARLGHTKPAAVVSIERVRMYDRGYRQSYQLFGLCFNSHPSYKLGWETGKRDLDDERIQDEIDNDRGRYEVDVDEDEVLNDPREPHQETGWGSFFILNKLCISLNPSVGYKIII